MILDTIKKLLSEQLGIDPEKITEQTNFKTELNADSLDLVEMMLALEEEYGISFENVELEKFETVGDVINCIEELKK